MVEQGGFIPEIKRFAELGSTNSSLLELAKVGVEAGLIIRADSQTSGKGRLGRNWVSGKGKGLYFSLLVDSQLPPDLLGRYSIGTAVALKRVLQNLYGLGSEVKWPNDILIGGKKLAGILLEAVSVQGKLRLVIGIGVNVNWVEDDYIGEFRTTPTALNSELGKVVDMDMLFGEMVKSLQALFVAIYDDNGWSKVVEEVNLVLYGKGNLTTINLAKGSISGIINSIADNGGIIIDRDGVLETVVSGEI